MNEKRDKRGGNFVPILIVALILACPLSLGPAIMLVQPRSIGETFSDPGAERLASRFYLPRLLQAGNESLILPEV